MVGCPTKQEGRLSAFQRFEISSLNVIRVTDAEELNLLA